MSERNWAEDWEICQRATREPWTMLKDEWYDYFWIRIGNGCNYYYIRGLLQDDAEFISESREALPYWLLRVKDLEELLEDAKKEIASVCLDCDVAPFSPGNPYLPEICGNPACSFPKLFKRINKYLGGEVKNG